MTDEASLMRVWINQAELTLGERTEWGSQRSERRFFSGHNGAGVQVYH